LNYGGTKFDQKSSETGICRNVEDTIFNDLNNCTTVSIDEFENFGKTVNYLFRTTFGYQLNETTMHSINESATYSLVGIYIGLGTLLLVNIFIAQLSTTFARLYENAESYHYFKKAIEILEREKIWNKVDRKQFKSTFRSYYNPTYCVKGYESSFFKKIFGGDYIKKSSNDKISNLENEMREQQKQIAEQRKYLESSVI
jgi:hypothetical protein